MSYRMNKILIYRYIDGIENNILILHMPAYPQLQKTYTQTCAHTLICIYTHL